MVGTIAIILAQPQGIEGSYKTHRYEGRGELPLLLLAKFNSTMGISRQGMGEQSERDKDGW